MSDIIEVLFNRYVQELDKEFPKEMELIRKDKPAWFLSSSSFGPYNKGLLGMLSAEVQVAVVRNSLEYQMEKSAQARALMFFDVPVSIIRKINAAYSRAITKLDELYL